MRPPARFAFSLAFVSVLACAGERLPLSAARPEGTHWYCAHGGWSACGRTQPSCPGENVRVGSRVVNAGAVPKAAECVEQPTAVCYTYFDPTSRKTLYDCFIDRVECEGYRKEAARSPAQHEELSVCGTWD